MTQKGMLEMTHEKNEKRPILTPNEAPPCTLYLSLKVLEKDNYHLSY